MLIKPVMCLTAAIAALAAGQVASAALVLVDAGFDSPIATALQIDQTTVGGWYTQSENGGGWTQDSSFEGRSAATQFETGNRNVAQVIHDGQETTGVVTLSFDYASRDTNNDQVLVPRIYGTNAATFSLDLSNTGTLSNLTTLGDSYAINSAIKSTDKTVGWTEFSLDVDLGASGYEYLVVLFVGKSRVGATGVDDYVAVDSVSLAPEPASSALALTGAGLMLVRPARRRKS